MSFLVAHQVGSLSYCTGLRQVTGGGNDLQTWSVTVNVLNTQSRTADKA